MIHDWVCLALIKSAYYAVETHYILNLTSALVRIVSQQAILNTPMDQILNEMQVEEGKKKAGKRQ